MYILLNPFSWVFLVKLLFVLRTISKDLGYIHIFIVCLCLSMYPWLSWNSDWAPAKSFLFPYPSPSITIHTESCFHALPVLWVNTFLKWACRHSLAFLCLHCICIQFWQYLITICEWYNVNSFVSEFFFLCSVVCLWPSSLLFRSYLVWQSSTWVHYSLFIIVFLRFSLPKLTSAFYSLNSFVEI